jgi:hypothetical protein
MYDPNNLDIDVIELLKKKRIKDKISEQRKIEKLQKGHIKCME